MGGMDGLHLAATFWNKKIYPLIEQKLFMVIKTHCGDTVDGRNPAPPGMYKTL